MTKKSEMLRNWINGLFGNENRTRKITNDLVNELLKEGFTGFKSEYIDYPNGETYRLDLQILKIEQSDKPITVKIDAEEVLKKIQEEKQKINKFGNWTGCPHFKEE